MQQPSIAIVGGGITGLTLAVALLRRGINIKIYEQSRGFEEIGAGVAFNIAAVRAMEVCSPDIVTCFRKVRTGNADPNKQNDFYDWYNAMSDTKAGQSEYWFTMKTDGGVSGCHRAHYLNEISQLIPAGTTDFKKRLETIEELENHQVKLKFSDGSEAVHDAVVGADGIKSTVRKWILGDHPTAAAVPRYTHKYAYRALIPMPRAVEALGKEFGLNAKFYLGQNGHVLTLPIARGTLLNVVFFFTDPSEWPDHEHLVRPADREHVRRDFDGFGATVQKIIDLAEPNISCWAIFEVADVPYYNKGRVIILGDAGHASSPHMGAGAGIGIEDCAILAELLFHPSLRSGDRSIESAFEAFTKQRLERTHWLVESSKRVGEVFDWRTEYGGDKNKIKEELQTRFNNVWNGQIKDYIAQAIKLLEATS